MITAFVAGPVFVGDGSVLENANVLVEDGKITRVTQEKLDLGPEVRKISLAGGMLLPGLIDSHVHLIMEAGPDPLTKVMSLSVPANTINAAGLAKRTLLAGFTTVRDMGGAFGIDLGLRDAIKAGKIPGPRMLASGRVVCMTGGHGWQMDACEADGPHEVRKAVRSQLKAGVDR